MPSRYPAAIALPLASRCSAHACTSPIARSRSCARVGEENLQHRFVLDDKWGAVAGQPAGECFPPGGGDLVGGALTTPDGGGVFGGEAVGGEVAKFGVNDRFGGRPEDVPEPTRQPGQVVSGVRADSELPEQRVGDGRRALCCHTFDITLTQSKIGGEKRGTHHDL